MQASYWLVYCKRAPKKKKKHIKNRNDCREAEIWRMATASFLGNRYWILRHGKSIPNEKGLIVSSIVCDSLPFFHFLFDLMFYSLLVVWFVRKWRFLGSCLILICCGEFSQNRSLELF